MLKAVLLFPPGWSLNVGSPHLALPLLKAALDQKGVSVRMKDLNWEIAESYGVHISQEDALRAVDISTMEALNTVYFGAEDKLMQIAHSFDGEWNLQLGFNFKSFSFSSSRDIREALRAKSPFTDYFVKHVIPWLERESPRLVGFTVSSSYQIVPALHLCWLLRNAGYCGFIIFGGNIISRLKHEIVGLPWLFDLVDGFIIFQGELPLVALTKCLVSNGSLSDVPNLVWRNNGIIQENVMMSFQDPNAYPTPDFDDLSVGRYWGVNYLPVLAARGCYYGKCVFCAIPYGYDSQGFGGIRDARSVLKDIVTLKDRNNIHRFKFMDEAVPPSILKELSELILRDKLHIEWEGFVRLERDWLNEPFVTKLAQSGFSKGSFGLEIYPSQERDGLGKNDNANDILEILKVCNSAGVKVHLFCMFGFSGTGRQEAETTVEFILRNKHWIDTVDLNPFKYAKHTAVNGIEKITRMGQDLALEYDYKPYEKGSLCSAEVEELTDEMEDLVWRECPRLLHPIYRLVSPWNPRRMADSSRENENALAVSC